MITGLVGLSALVATPNNAVAIPFTTDLVITGTVELDDSTTIQTTGSQETA